MHQLNMLNITKSGARKARKALISRVVALNRRWIQYDSMWSSALRDATAVPKEMLETEWNGESRGPLIYGLLELIGPASDHLGLN